MDHFFLTLLNKNKKYLRVKETTTSPRPFFTACVALLLKPVHHAIEEHVMLMMEIILRNAHKGCMGKVFMGASRASHSLIKSKGRQVRILLLLDALYRDRVSAMSNSRHSQLAYMKPQF